MEFKYFQELLIAFSRIWNFENGTSCRTFENEYNREINCFKNHIVFGIAVIFRKGYKFRLSLYLIYWCAKN